MTTRLTITYILNLFDLAITTFWVQLFGLSIESNPFGRWLYNNNLAYTVKVLGIGFLLFTLYRLFKWCPKLAWMSWVVTGAYSVLAVYHVYVAANVFSIMPFSF